MKTRVTIMLVCLLSIFCTSLHAQKYIIRGNITDFKDGNKLYSAIVYDSLSHNKAISNEHGNYYMVIPKGKVKITVKHIGYETIYKEFLLQRDTTINLCMTESDDLLDEITVIGVNEDIGVKSSLMGAIEIPVHQIKATPTFMGESDVIKMLQALPGVQSGTDGTTRMYVRGGSADENLFLMDGVQIFSPSHSGGFFSVFDPEMLDNVTLYKGVFPARYGGRLSSVTDISLDNGNLQEHHQSISLGMLSSKVHLEGPLNKGKTSYNISARYSYLNAIINKLLKDEDFSIEHEEDNLDDVVSSTFYDITGKIFHKFNSRNTLSLSFYRGGDKNDAATDRNWYNFDMHKITINSSKLNKWGNTAGILKWNGKISPDIAFDISAKYTDFQGKDINFQNIDTLFYKIKDGKIVEDKTVKAEHRIDYISKLSDFTHAANLIYSAGSSKIKAGYDYTIHITKPGVYSSTHSDVFDDKDEFVTDYHNSNNTGGNNITNHEIALYAENDHNLTDWLKINYGFRTGAFFTKGKTYFSIQPRISARVLTSDKVALKVSYSSSQQNIHLLSSNNLTTFSDIWIYSTSNIRPSVAQQVSFGVNYTHKFADINIEAYYKALDNILEYKDNVSFLNGSNAWEDKVCVGKGWSYGVEFMLQKKFGKTTGWLAYTWSKAERKFDKPGNILNKGEKFYAKQDRRHDFKFIISHRASKRFNVNAAFYFATGQCGDLAIEDYKAFSLGSSSFIDFWHGLSDSGSWDKTGYYPVKNGFRMPNSHRLDVSMDINFFHKKERNSTLNLGIYNIYNKANPVIIEVGPDPDLYVNGVTSTRLQFIGISYFQIMPSVSYTFNF